MVIGLERDADLHMAQPMSLQLTVSCFSEIQNLNFRLLLRFWYRLTWVVLDKGLLNGCVHVCSAIMEALISSLSLKQHCQSTEGNCPKTCTLHISHKAVLPPNKNQPTVQHTPSEYLVCDRQILLQVAYKFRCLSH